MKAARAVGVAQLIASAAYLIRNVPRLKSDPAGSWQQRINQAGVVLSARRGLQGSALLIRPSPCLLKIAAATDFVHAASMAGAASYWPPPRRPALMSGALAMTFGLLEAWLGWAHPTDPVGRKRHPGRPA
jgi:hypothetical protein